LRADDRRITADLFEVAGRFGFSPDALKTRLLGASRRADDPGIETTKGAAPSFEQLKVYFAELIDRQEQAEAEAAAKRRQGEKKNNQRSAQSR
jgi:hypothetical protein